MNMYWVHCALDFLGTRGDVAEVRWSLSLCFVLVKLALTLPAVPDFCAFVRFLLFQLLLFVSV